MAPLPFNRTPIWLLTLVALATGATGCSTAEICEDQITWAPGSDQVNISKNDRLLICGDPAHNSWKKIPPRQSANFLRSYLESQAYLDPKIDIDYDANRIRVNAGPRARVTDISVTGTVTPGFTVSPLLMHIDEALEKSTLDKISGEALELLKSLGYACATLELEAHPDGRVILKLNSGAIENFPGVHDVLNPEVDSDILARYEPFHLGDRAGWRTTLNRP